MRRLSIFFCLLYLTVRCDASDAQQVLPQATSDASSCDSLHEVVPDGVRTIASSLNVCRDLQRILLRHGIAPPGSLNSLSAEPGLHSEETPLQSAQDERSMEEDLQARQHIADAINRAVLDSNLVLLKAHNTLLELQMSTFNAEQRAYRRTKILNAFLGTTVGAIGSGMQFSNNVSVQHAGDAVSVGGGVITAVFAICTADIDVIEQLPTDQISEAFANDNQKGAVPDDVWNYLKSDVALRGAFEVSLGARQHKQKSLTGHWKQSPPGKNLEAQVKLLSILDNSLAQMNRDMADLSQTMAVH